ncbi:MAG: hypothetical protein ACYC0B_01965 [Gemmatimonadaceae bacterium]
MTTILPPKVRLVVLECTRLAEEINAKLYDAAPEAKAPSSWARGVSLSALVDSGVLSDNGIEYEDAEIAIRELLAIGHLRCDVPPEVRRGLHPERCWVLITYTGRAWLAAEQAVNQSAVDAKARAAIVAGAKGEG